MLSWGARYSWRGQRHWLKPPGLLDDAAFVILVVDLGYMAKEVG